MASSSKINFDLVLRYQKFAENAKKAATQWKKTGQEMTSIGRDLSFAVSAPLLLIGKQALEIGREFDLALAKIKGLSAGRADLAALESQARELGATTIFTATSISELQLSLLRLGKTDAEIQQLTPTVLRFAQALDTDLASAGTFIVQTLNRMDDSFSSFFSTSDAAAFAAEGMAYAVANSALTVDSLQASLNYVGSEANAAGLSFSETTALLAQLADAGYTGSRAGTQLRRVFTELTKDGVDVSKQFFDIVKSGYSFEEALQKVGVRAAGVFSALGGSSEEVLKFSQAIQESTGYTEFFAESLDESLEASSKKVESAFGELSIVLTKNLKPTLVALNEIIANVFRGFSKFSTAGQTAVIVIGSILVVLPPLIFLIGSLKKAIAGLTVNVAGLGLALKVALPILSLVSVVAAVFAYNMGGIEEQAKTTSQEIQSLADRINELAKQGRRREAVQLATKEREEAEKRVEALEEQIKVYGRQVAVTETISRLTNSWTSGNRDAVDYNIQALKTQIPLQADLIEANRDRLTELQKIARSESANLVETRTQLAISRESVKIQQQIVEQTNKYLNANSDIVQAIEEEEKANRTVLISVTDLTKEYRSLQNQVINIQNQFQQGGVTQNEINSVKDLENQIKNLRTQLELLGVDVDQLDGGFINPKTVKDLQDRYTQLKNTLSNLNASEVIDFERVASVNEELSKLENLWGLIGRSLENLEGSDQYIKAQNEATDDAEKKTNAFNEAIASLQSRISGVGADSLQSQLKQLSYELNQTIDSLDLSGEQAQELTNEYTKLAAALVQLNEEQKEIAYSNAVGTWMSGIISLSQQFVMNIFDMIDGTKTLGQVVGDVIKRMLAKVIGLILAWAVLNALMGRGGAIGAAATTALSGTSTLTSFLSSNLLGGMAPPTRSSSGMRVAGVVSGSNLVISTERGITAYDRTYG